MILLSAKGIRKHFGSKTVLADVDLAIRPGDRIGLVGPNGTGKSTLLHILTGNLEADDGEVTRHGSVSVGVLAQHANFQPGRTVWEQAEAALAHWIEMAAQAEQLAAQIASTSDDSELKRLGERFDHLQVQLAQHDAYRLDHRIERVLMGLGLDRTTYDQDISGLSGGQQNRLLLAVLLLREPDVMLLDEPSNHLDIEATGWLEEFLAQSKSAQLIVSHDRYLLDKVTNRTAELFHGTVDSYKGNFSAYWRQQHERVAVQRRTYARQQEWIEKTEDFIRRNHYGQKHVQAEDRRRKLERLERVAPPREIPAPAFCLPAAPRSGDIVLRLESIGKSYDKPLFTDFSLTITRGERWGILGPNGSGKTTLLRCILGETQLDSGQIVVGTGVKIAYYDQLLGGLDPQIEVIDAVRPDEKDFHEQQRRNLLARFGIVGDMVWQRVESLSGGERSRVALARLAASEANVLALDEPTNHLDLWARDSLEHALSEFDGTVLLVSHDRYLLNRVADHLLVLETSGPRIVEGNYDLYVHLTERDAASAAPGAAKKRAARGGAQRTPARTWRFPYRKIGEIEADIFQHETRIKEIHIQLAEPNVQRNGERVRQLHGELTEQQQTLTQLYEHWEEAAERN